VKPVHQTEFSLRRGNCLQASVASVLELSLDEVPNFMLDPDSLTASLDKFLSKFGLVSLTLHADQMSGWKPTGYHLMGGPSLRHAGDIWHSVVGLDGDIAFDPHPSGVGLCEVKDYTVFVADMHRPSIYTKGE